MVLRLNNRLRPLKSNQGATLLPRMMPGLKVWACTSEQANTFSKQQEQETLKPNLITWQEQPPHPATCLTSVIFAQVKPAASTPQLSSDISKAERAGEGVTSGVKSDGTLRGDEGALRGRRCRGGGSPHPSRTRRSQGCLEKRGSKGRRGAKRAQRAAEGLEFKVKTPQSVSEKGAGVRGGGFSSAEQAEGRPGSRRGRTGEGEIAEGTQGAAATGRDRHNSPAGGQRLPAERGQAGCRPPRSVPGTATARPPPPRAGRCLLPPHGARVSGVSGTSPPPLLREARPPPLAARPRAGCGPDGLPPAPPAAICPLCDHGEEGAGGGGRDAPVPPRRGGAAGPGVRRGRGADPGLAEQGEEGGQA